MSCDKLRVIVPLIRDMILVSAFSAFFVRPLHAQPSDSVKAIVFDFHYQQTLIVQSHAAFRSPYYGENSFAANEPPATTLTSTFFTGVSFPYSFSLELDPEISGGKGLSGTEGIAGFPNGDAFRVGDAAPKLYIGRAFLKKAFEFFQSNGNVVVGKFSLADYFDNNLYSNSPRTQFINWALMNNGAWDYASDTRGYTDGIMVEYFHDNFSLRFAEALEPKVANGPNLDFDISKAHSENMEGEMDYDLGGLQGKVRVLTFLNSAKMANYAELTNDSLYHHDVTLDRKYGRNKYGFGVNIEQCLGESAGAFFRFGWNDGQNETWDYAEIDRTISAGILFSQGFLNRHDDNFGIAFAVNSISSAHRNFLNCGCYGFQIGDGRLKHYGTENILEAYYLFQVTKLIGITFDYQFVMNPAYNRDRGPVNIFGVRGHIEI